MSSRRPPRGPGGGSRGGYNPPPTSAPDDTPAQTNLGQLLQRAMEAAQRSTEAPVAEPVTEEEEAERKRGLKLCADCWNAITFKDEAGRHMARCAKDLWVKPAFTYDELNNNKIRRWYADCPEYDDSE